jgi:transcriptional regulator with XRE-family HTH domain
MNHEETPFEKLFTEHLKQRNISIKKIAEMTGISRAHLENIASGNFKDLPSAPYFRGYLIRLGKILDFDGETWWEEIKKESTLKKSGPKDTLPRNRFTKKRPTKFILAGVLLIIAILYFILQFARISGEPSVTLAFPTENPYTASSSELILRGIVTNADSLSVNGETVPLLVGGAWQKDVLLQNGLNPFAIRAKKFLGGESDVVEQILYNEPAAETSMTSTTSKILPPADASGTSSSTMP